ncbi:WD40 repeat domain-containing protein [Actinoplanes sp. NPDC049668]|uniref:WD40 repeat domain-containing protein n=1 Tax=unclassified Actinoplanes TaxID=2626549 RepID=UPI0033B2C3B4
MIINGPRGTVRVWDPHTRRPIDVPTETAKVAFSPDGKLLATLDKYGTGQVWDRATGRPVGAALPGPNDLAHFGPNGTLITGSSQGPTVRWWNARTGRPSGAPLAGSMPVAFAPDDKRMITQGKDGLRLRDSATGRPIGEPIGEPGDKIRDAEFSRDSKMLAVSLFPYMGDDNGIMPLWDPATGRQVGTLPAEEDDTDITFSSDGQRLVILYRPFFAMLWDPQTQKQVGPDLAEATAAQFSPDSRLLATSASDGTVRLRNSATGHPIGTPLTGSLEDASEVTFSPDSKVLARVDDAGVARLWDVPFQQDPLAYLCGRVGGLTEDEWLTYAPNERVVKAC